MVAGGCVAARLIDRRSSVRVRKDCWYAAQCSRSTARRSRSPSRARALPRRRRRLPRSRPRGGGCLGEEDRQARRHDQMVESTPGMLGDPLPFLLVDHVPSPLDRHTGRARIDHQRDGSVRSRGSRPTWLAADSRSHCRASVRKRGPPSSSSLQVVQERLLRQLGWRQVSEVLVQPVRHEGSRDPLVPPRQPAHLLDPGVGDVPVVVDVVIVEDHGARHRRQQPADIGVRPRIAIEAGVLLEVRDLFARSLAYVASRTDELCSVRRNEVRVHLVAEQQERVGPWNLSLLELFRIRPESVDLESLLVFGPRQ